MNNEKMPLEGNPKLKVKFTGPWQKVGGDPVFVFQAVESKDVSFENRPETINPIIQAVEDHSPPFPTTPAGPGNDDDGGLSGGAIAGIVIGVLAAVGIAGFCVWYFVLRPKKQGVEGTKP
jgi:hypothetical protein